MPNINRRTQIGQLLSLLADDLLSMGVSMTSETPFFCLTGNETDTYRCNKGDKPSSFSTLLPLLYSLFMTCEDLSEKKVYDP